MVSYARAINQNADQLQDILAVFKPVDPAEVPGQRLVDIAGKAEEQRLFPPRGAAQATINFIDDMVGKRLRSRGWRGQDAVIQSHADDAKRKKLIRHGNFLMNA